VHIGPQAEGARNYTQCDSMLIGSDCAAHTVPTIRAGHPTARVEHEATTSKVGQDQLFYFAQRGIDQEEAIAMIINGFCQDVFTQLPMEFAVEATKLVGLKLENSVG
jgi:Fe-S cluster assembly protein SufB